MRAALSGDGSTALLGLPTKWVGDNSNQGVAYVFVKSGGTWSQQKLTASDGAADDWFGESAALSSDGATALIGAPKTNMTAIPGPGAAYYFVKSGGTWSQAKLTPTDGTQADSFGDSAALSSDGGTALIGAPAKTVGSNIQQGAAYYFVKSGGTWSQQKLTASDGAAYDNFGHSAALSSDGTTALIGCEMVAANSQQGAAYVFVNSAGTWSQQELTASDGMAGDFFGSPVALSSDGATALIGASGVNQYQGAAYVFAAPAAPTYSVSGAVTDNSSSALSGVSVHIAGSPAQDTSTASDGTYSFSGIKDGNSYTITPSYTQYQFNPAFSGFTVNGGNPPAQNFIGTKTQAVNGACGASENGMFTSAPTTGFCSTGTSGPVTGKGPWNWTCQGSGGGTPAQCSAEYGVNGACGSAGGGDFIKAPALDLCSPGTASKVTSANGSWTWTCKGSHSGATASCSANVEANGACGSANKKNYLTQPPTAKLCAAGTAEGITMNGPWTWTCTGSNGGAQANCSAKLEVIGACGPANKSSYYAQPSSSDLCTGGTASKVTGKGPWNWSCAGSNGGSTAKCSAKLEANGACGSANGEDLLKAPASNLCSTGKASKVTGTGPWNWTCSGSNGGSTASCSANLK